MCAIATDGVARSVCVCVCLCVCLLVTFVSFAKTVEQIEMPFGADTGGPSNHALDGDPGPLGDGASFEVVQSIEIHGESVCGLC